MINKTTRTHYQFNIINIHVTVLGLLIFPFSYFEDIIPPFFFLKKRICILSYGHLFNDVFFIFFLCCKLFSFMFTKCWPLKILFMDLDISFFCFWVFFIFYWNPYYIWNSTWLQLTQTASKDSAKLQSPFLI